VFSCLPWSLPRLIFVPPVQALAEGFQVDWAPLMYMDTEDSKQLLNEVRRFARERIAGMAARPESPINADQLTLLTQEACELGILPLATADDGFSIWEHSNVAQAMSFNTGALRHIAYASPGVAFAWHRLALARFVCVQLGLAFETNVQQGMLLVPTGHYGLARNSLGKWLKAHALSAEDKDMLSDWLDRSVNATTIYAPKDWKSLVWPVWSDDQIAWRYVERKELDVSSGNAQHGFDELAGFAVRQPSTAGKAIKLDPDASRSTYASMFKLDVLGLLSIGAGALDRGQALARDYAGIRKQGGKVIAEHPAVQHMLSDIEIARHNVDMALAAFSQPVDELDVGTIAAARASLSPALCQAANQVVQVHGGIGYMRDAGPEKLVRDQNMLKLIAGGTREIHAFLAGWTGASV